MTTDSNGKGVIKSIKVERVAKTTKGVKELKKGGKEWIEDDRN